MLHFSVKDFVGKLFADKPSVDKFFVDKLLVDKTFADKPFVDNPFPIKFFVDKSFVDKHLVHMFHVFTSSDDKFIAKTSPTRFLLTHVLFRSSWLTESLSRGSSFRATSPRMASRNVTLLE
ncbi:unnamed protein product, partial [Ixodes persulcatus]